MRLSALAVAVSLALGAGLLTGCDRDDERAIQPGSTGSTSQPGSTSAAGGTSSPSDSSAPTSSSPYSAPQDPAEEKKQQQ